LEPLAIAIPAVIIFGVAVVLGWRVVLGPKPVVIVVLKSGETIRGVLLSRGPGTVKLGGAELLETGKATPIDGDLYLDRNNVRWMQRPT
jgi:hypothetical protein